MPLKCRDVIKILEKLAHPKHAEGWDNIGLQIGDPDSIVKKLMVTLDVTLSVVDEAIKQEVDLLIVHHTPMFKPLKDILWNRPQGKIVQKLIQANINLYCAHTNLDSAPGGVNDVLAQMLDLKDIQVLSPSWEEEYIKLVVFVPNGYEEQIREAISRQGAGWIGNYSDCTFQLSGTGTFRPLEGTNPFIGAKGQLEKVEEYRLETIVPRQLIENVVKAMIEAHPYEEVAYDLYPLANKGPVSGLGRIGILQEKISLEDLLNRLSNKLNIKNLKFVGDLEQKVEKIALCGGSGASLINEAFKKGADIYITGDIKYHEAQEAESLGLFLIDAGHFATEFPVVQSVANFLQENLAGKDIQIITSQINTDPFKFFTR